MAACTLGGVSNIKLSNFHLDSTKRKYFTVERLGSIRRTWIQQKPLQFAGSARQLWRFTSPSIVSCGPSSEILSTEDGSEEKKSSRNAKSVVPNSVEVQSLLTEICDTSSIAEFELKLDGFRLYVMRDVNGKNKQTLPHISPPVNTNVTVETVDSNGSAAPTSLAITIPPRPSEGRIQRLLSNAADEGLVILQSPKVGYFRRSRTIKGKRAPPSCKEKQMVKEGQVVCYVEQLGGEMPVKSEVSGEIIKILREEAEPVGYGDPLIAVLPSFPGIKKLQ